MNTYCMCSWAQISAVGIVVMMRMNGQAGGPQKGVDSRVLAPVLQLMRVIQRPGAQAQEAHQQHDGSNAIQRRRLSEPACRSASGFHPLYTGTFCLAIESIRLRGRSAEPERGRVRLL